MIIDANGPCVRTLWRAGLAFEIADWGIPEVLGTLYLLRSEIGKWTKDTEEKDIADACWWSGEPSVLIEILCGTGWLTRLRDGWYELGPSWSTEMIDEVEI